MTLSSSKNLSVLSKQASKQASKQYFLKNKIPDSSATQFPSIVLIPLYQALRTFIQHSPATG